MGSLWPVPCSVRVHLNIWGLSLWAQWVLLDKAPKPRPLEVRGGFCHQLCPKLFNQWLPRSQMFFFRKSRQDWLSCRTVCDGLILAKNSASLSLTSHCRWHLKNTRAKASVEKELDTINDFSEFLLHIHLKFLEHVRKLYFNYLASYHFYVICKYNNRN